MLNSTCKNSEKYALFPETTYTNHSFAGPWPKGQYVISEGKHYYQLESLIKLKAASMKKNLWIKNYAKFHNILNIENH